jgi:NADPH:quinone reductase-like Zn-dependent oxidoreductase
MSKTLSSQLLHAMFRDLQGQYQVKPKLPFVPGSECSGTVIEVGRDVRTVKVGDKV